MTKNSVHACSSSDVMSLCTFIAVMYFILQVTNLICSVDLSSRDHHSPSFPLNKTNRITINIRISYLWYKIKKIISSCEYTASSINDLDHVENTCPLLKIKKNKRSKLRKDPLRHIVTNVSDHKINSNNG